MATSTNSNTISKVIRIQDDEKELLSRLREIYANDYKKYSEYIKRESNVPVSIKKIYKLLDERKAYRRISDYFHRERVAKKARSSQSNSLNRSYHRSLTRGITQISEPILAIQMNNGMNDEDDNDHQQSDSPTMTNDSDELFKNNHIIDDDAQQTQKLSLINDQNQQSIITPYISSKPDLLSVRASIQKALHELDRVIISKSDIITEEDNDEQQQRLLIRQTNDHCHSKLDDIVRSLSNVVNQQQENVRLIINESSSLLINDNKQTTTQESIKYILERLNSLIDRGHFIYDRIENILSEF